MPTYALNANRVLNTSPIQKVDAAAGGGICRVISDVITLASQPSGDYIFIGGQKLPVNAQVLRVWLNTDTSLGSSTVAVGTVAAPAKYRAAATLTATNTPTASGVVAGTVAPLNAAEQLILSVTTANLPASGQLEVVVEYVLD